MTEDKSKYELTIDFIMIVAKYFKSNNDFINVMEVCKRYEELVSMYKFNPISDISLFENIQTQHFYDESDVKNKKNNLFQYIYWINDDKIINNKKDNEIFKVVKQNVYLQIIINNIPTLEEWCGLKFKEILYDSAIDGKLNQTLFKKLLQKKNLYFISIDSNNNVFGHYHPGKILYSNSDNYDRNIFLFSLYSNGRNDKVKFKSISKHTLCTKLYNRSYVMYCGSWNEDGYKLYSYDSNESYIGAHVGESFIGCDKFSFTGESSLMDKEDGSVLFKLRRLVVIQME